MSSSTNCNTIIYETSLITSVLKLEKLEESISNQYAMSLSSHQATDRSHLISEFTFSNSSQTRASGILLDSRINVNNEHLAPIYNSIPLSRATSRDTSNLESTNLGTKTHALHNRESSSGYFSIELDQLSSLPVHNLPNTSVSCFTPDNFLPHETPEEERNIGLDDSHIPLPINHLSPRLPNLDVLWTVLYFVLIFCILVTTLIVWSSTEQSMIPITQDCMYTMLKSNYSSVFGFMEITCIVGAAWMWSVKKFPCLVFQTSIILVPSGLVALTIHTLAKSYYSRNGNYIIQYNLMSWSTSILIIISILWTYLICKGRHAIERSVGVIKLGSEILTAYPSLLAINCIAVILYVGITWVWIQMLLQLLLKESILHSFGVTTWVQDAKSWMLGAIYILIYLWSWGIVSGIQRSITSTAVSQWYFHRHANRRVCSISTVASGLRSAMTTHFGTICFYSFLALLLRLPLLVMPTRMVSWIQLFVYNILPSSIISLTDPLVLCHAAMSSQDLIKSSRTISNLRYIDHGHNNPTSTNPHSWIAYRLSKQILLSCRLITSLSLGFCAWVHAAYYQNAGSSYGYTLGLITGFSVWIVLSASEGLLSKIVDSAFVCFAIDNSGRGMHCIEADELFSGVL